MLRTASSLPLTGLLTLGSDPARFQTEPPACYRASWQLPGPDSHRQATTSLRTREKTPWPTSRCHLLFCWAHENGSLTQAPRRPAGTEQPGWKILFSSTIPELVWPLRGTVIHSTENSPPSVLVTLVRRHQYRAGVRWQSSTSSGRRKITPTT